MQCIYGKDIFKNITQHLHHDAGRLDTVKFKTPNYNTLINKQTRPCLDVTFADILIHRCGHTTATFFTYSFFYFLVQLFIASLSLGNLSCVVVRSEPGYYTNHRHVVLILSALISPWGMQTMRRVEHLRAEPPNILLQEMQWTGLCTYDHNHQRSLFHTLPTLQLSSTLHDMD